MCVKASMTQHNDCYKPLCTHLLAKSVYVRLLPCCKAAGQSMGPTPHLMIPLLQNALQTDGHQLEGDAQMSTEEKMILHMDHVATPITVFVLDALQDFKLDKRSLLVTVL